MSAMWNLWNVESCSLYCPLMLKEYSALFIAVEGSAKGHFLAMHLKLDSETINKKIICSFWQLHAQILNSFLSEALEVIPFCWNLWFFVMSMTAECTLVKVIQICIYRCTLNCNKWLYIFYRNVSIGVIPFMMRNRSYYAHYTKSSNECNKDGATKKKMQEP